VSAFEAETLAQQLGQLGRDLQDGVTVLGKLEEEAVAAEGRYRAREYAYGDAMDRAFLDLPGSVEVRKAQARTTTGSYWHNSQDAYLEWSRAKARVRVQNANLSAIRTRIDVGRSLLSREKALLSLSGVGEV
jgi:hypothetical protein